MDVTQLKTQQKSLRTLFTQNAKVIEEELTKEVSDVDKLSILKMQISDKFLRLEKCQRGISNIILKEETDELAYGEDFMKAEIYRDRFLELCAKIESLSAVVSNSKAARVVENFPATADNYPKAIAKLHERFRREDLLVQIYVRDLLLMVLRNAAPGRSKSGLPALYDELEAKIRALERADRGQVWRVLEYFGLVLSPR
ncbi:DUF1758 domain-containing protein [Trichonephila clavipes]|nr:DUF1758 domain-containing protein [Trichonephila clavipes]